MSSLPAARVGDPFGHSSAMTGVLTGLAIGALVGVAIIATGGLGAIAIGAAIATTGAAGLAGQAIGQTLEGPVTGTLAVGSPTVFINNLSATMTALATGPCSTDSGPPRLLASGAATVFIHGQPAGRVSEAMDCSAVIRKGSSNVFIGGPSQQVLKIEPEVPTCLTKTMTAMAIGGTLIATGGIAATYGIGTAVGSLFGGIVGGKLGGAAGQSIAAAMGFGTTGQAVGTVAGEFVGGFLGGSAGFKGGKAFDARYEVTVEGLGANLGNVRIRPRPPADDNPSPFQTRYDPQKPGGPDPEWSVDTRRFDPKAPTAERTASNEIRDRTQFWKEWLERHPETLSKSNQYKINELNLSPVVDKTWTKSFPEHGAYKGEVLHHHHYNHGPLAIPLPETVHTGAGNTQIWHWKP